MDKKIEIDPRLFITCRLCLEELGIYQIVPAVKEQISYCFDINVEPFDGLPQLICKKCEEILNNYDTIKKKFVAKQNDLIKKIKGCVNNKPSQDAVKTLNESHESENEFPKRPCLSKKRRLVSSSSSASNNSNNVMNFNANDNSNNADEKIDDSDAHSDRADTWKMNYKKKFVCRVCDMQWSSSKSVLAHFNSRHYTLRKKYKHVFRQHCKVMLYSFDEKPNITGSYKNIVLDRDRIIANVNSKYYVVYTTKYKKLKVSSNRSFHEDSECSYFSDNDTVVKHKKRRLDSATSTDTVVLEGSDKSNSLPHIKKKSQEAKPSLDSECINIDDSSESEIEDDENKTNSISKTDILSETDATVKVDLDAIHEIITGCKSKYMKKRFNNDIMLKLNKNPSEVATQLKRKVLSIGRKVINSKSCNYRIMYCTPLLRFLEYKNLDVNWQTRSNNSDNVDTNFIRIISRVKYMAENNSTEAGWMDYHDSLPDDAVYREPVMPHVNNDKDKTVIGGAENELNGFSIKCVSATSIQNDNANLGDTRKLLNANPVANPKQLPKKTINTDTKVSPKMLLEVAHNDHDNIEMCMPIITSTTSLAPSVLLGDMDPNIKENDIPNSGTAEAPRIKVKSVTELMSKETLSRMHEPADHVMPCSVSPGTSLLKSPAQNETNMINVCISPNVNMGPQYQHLQVQSNNYVTVENVAQQDSASKTNNYVILDTFEFPNTKTTSPFDYFRRLLQVHNLTLLDLDVIPTQTFHCLLKFKVLFQQEPNKSVPVVLSLSLSCSKNTFLLTIKDRNQDNINIGKISANWQWEVLKVYRGGEVIGRILNNAQKISPEVFDFTNSFLCLLKSINYVKPA